jgi:hypothetical protein
MRGNLPGLGMIRLIKSDQGLRPLKICRGGWTHSVDVLARKLELASDLVGDDPAIDGQDHLLPGEGCRTLTARVSFRLLALGESQRGHKVFHHGTLFKLVFDGVHIVQTSRFEKFLEVLIQLMCLALEVTLGGHDILLVVVIVASSSCNPLGRRFCPFCCLWHLS